MNSFAVKPPKEGSREIANAPSCAESGCHPSGLTTGFKKKPSVQMRATTSGFEYSRTPSPLQLKQVLDRSPRVVTQAKLAATMQSSLVQRRCGFGKKDELTPSLPNGLGGQAILQTKSSAPEETKGSNLTENRTGLPDTLKSGIESMSGLSMDDVRVHYNSDKPAQLQALAYTQGSDIHVAPGQEQHLAHEAWHVVQQKQGRVAPTAQLKGIALNDDSSLECEADEMGRQALHPPLVQRKSPTDPLENSGSGVLQRVLSEKGWFDPANEPDDQSLDIVHFSDVQDAYALFQKSAAKLPGWEAVKNEPHTTVRFTTNLGLNAQGSTSLWVTGPDEKEYSAATDATIQQWASWIGPNTPVAIQIDINPRQVDFKMEAVAHTINHEVSLHAIPLLLHIRQLRKVNSAPKREEAALKFTAGRGSESAQHERFALGNNGNLLLAHKAMLENFHASGNKDSAQNLAGDYLADWNAHRDGAIAERQQNILALSVNKDVSQLTEQNLMHWLEDFRRRKKAAPSTITAKEQSKANEVRALLDLLKYTYEAHREEVLGTSGFDISPDQNL